MATKRTKRTRKRRKLKKTRRKRRKRTKRRRRKKPKPKVKPKKKQKAKYINSLVLRSMIKRQRASRNAIMRGVFRYIKAEKLKCKNRCSLIRIDQKLSKVTGLSEGTKVKSHYLRKLVFLSGGNP